MADILSYEEVAALALRLPVNDQLRLARELLRLEQAKASPDGLKWADIRGMAPYPLCGEDAQAWVTRSRRADDERAEAELRRAFGDD